MQKHSPERCKYDIQLFHDQEESFSNANLCVTTSFSDTFIAYNGSYTHLIVPLQVCRNRYCSQKTVNNIKPYTPSLRGNDVFSENSADIAFDVAPDIPILPLIPRYPARGLILGWDCIAWQPVTALKTFWVFESAF